MDAIISSGRTSRRSRAKGVVGTLAATAALVGGALALSPASAAAFEEDGPACDPYGYCGDNPWGDNINTGDIDVGWGSKGNGSSPSNGWPWEDVPPPSPSPSGISNAPLCYETTGGWVCPLPGDGSVYPPDIPEDVLCEPASGGQWICSLPGSGEVYNESGNLDDPGPPARKPSKRSTQRRKAKAHRAAGAGHRKAHR
jgi:hypothetical protein